MTKILLILALIFFSVAAHSQNFKLGFQASPHITWMNSTNSTITNQELNLGIKYGLEADIFLAGFPRYIINTGLFVANHSFAAHYVPEQPFFINDASFSTPVDIRYKLNYIEIPLDIKLKSDQFYRMTYYGQFGLTNLINISASATSNDSTFKGDKINDGLHKRTIAPYYLCMIMGGGVEYDVGGNTALNFGIQYSNGLIDVTSISNLNEKTIFNSVRFVVGVMF